MNKETLEFAQFPAKLIDSTWQSLSDGKFEPLKDLANYFDDLLSAPDAFKGLESLNDEGATMTDTEKAQILDSIFAAMPNVTPGYRYDLSAGIHGILAIFRVAWRSGYEKGLQSEK